jgi:hypothetical protein
VDQAERAPGVAGGAPVGLRNHAALVQNVDAGTADLGGGLIGEMRGLGWEMGGFGWKNGVFEVDLVGKWEMGGKKNSVFFDGRVSFFFFFFFLKIKVL